MVIVPRIAAVSYLDAIPFIYGIRHDANFRAGELMLSTPDQCAEYFLQGKTDIALVPSSVVPSLADAEIVTEYCLGFCGPSRTCVLLSNDDLPALRRVFFDRHSPAVASLAVYLLQKRWKISPEYFVLKDLQQLRYPVPGDAFVLAGDGTFAAEGLFNHVWDLTGEWRKAVRLPFAAAVWVARKGTDYEQIEGLQHALTFGVEHTYEAVLAEGLANDPRDVYGYLTRHVDYIFDQQKQKALKKLWDSGIKVSPRANPG